MNDFRFYTFSLTRYSSLSRGSGRSPLPDSPSFLSTFILFLMGALGEKFMEGERVITEGTRGRERGRLDHGGFSC